MRASAEAADVVPLDPLSPPPALTVAESEQSMPCAPAWHAQVPATHEPRPEQLLMQELTGHCRGLQSGGKKPGTHEHAVTGGAPPRGALLPSMLLLWSRSSFFVFIHQGTMSLRTSSDAGDGASRNKSMPRPPLHEPAARAAVPAALS